MPLMFRLLKTGHKSGPRRSHGAFLYCLALATVVLLALGYAERRDLYGRYLEHLDTEEDIRHGTERREALRNTVEETGQRVRFLNEDPLEIEAALRNNKNLVREGETIYRIKLIPEDEYRGGHTLGAKPTDAEPVPDVERQVNIDENIDKEDKFQ